MTGVGSIGRCVAFFSFLSVACLISAGPVLAGNADMPGCNAKVKKALEAKSKYMVAQSMATTKQIIKKPDSVLALGCTLYSALETAKKGEFTGDISNDVAAPIKEMVASHYKNYQDSFGRSKGVVNYDTSGTVNNCDNISKLFDVVNKTGIEEGVAVVTAKEVIEGKLPADVGTNYRTNVNADKAAAQELLDAEADLPRPETLNIGYSEGDTSCETMMKYGITKDCD